MHISKQCHTVEIDKIYDIQMQGKIDGNMLITIILLEWVIKCTSRQWYTGVIGKIYDM